MKNTARWSLIVSKETDVSLRTFFAQKGLRRSDLSKFVEEAVRWRLLDRVMMETKKKNSNASARKLTAAIDETLEAVRARATQRH